MAVTRRMRVDIIRCDGHGYCAELLPERIVLDDWGYPMIDAAPLQGSAMLDHARRAAAACPLNALRVEEAAEA